MFNSPSTGRSVGVPAETGVGTTVSAGARVGEIDGAFRGQQARGTVQKRSQGEDG